MGYKFKSIPTRYNGALYRSRLEARWAAFFDLMKWPCTYEPYDLDKWSPDFKIMTSAGTNFLVEVKPNDLIDVKLRLKIGEASNYSDGILLVSESSFNYPYPNCIGLTSLFSKIKNYKDEDDFEFCTSVVMDRYGEGLDIYNLCHGDEEVYARLDIEDDFCSPVWAEAGNIVQFLKPDK